MEEHLEAFLCVVVAEVMEGGSRGPPTRRWILEAWSIHHKDRVGCVGGCGDTPVDEG